MSELPEAFLNMLAHELRTPVASIIGYHDLMNEGILGEVEPRIAEALTRIRSSADQLLTLVAGLGEIAETDVANLHVETDDEDATSIVQHVMDTLSSEAMGRSTNVVVDAMPEPGVFHTDCERVERALLLTLHAAIKNTAGGELHLNAATDEAGLVCVITGARLEPARDDAAGGSAEVATAAGLRLAMARQSILPLGGSIVLTNDHGQTTVTVSVPRSSQDD